MTRRVLIAWEFGSGLGHIAGMWPIIQALRARGVEPLVVVPDPDGARAVLGSESPRFIRVPAFPKRVATVKPPESFADLLLNRGFRDAGALDPAIDAWRTLYREDRIETVLIDYAPVAQLAAWLEGLSMVSFSTSFASPPVPLPAFESASPTSRRAAQSGERELIACVNRVAAKAGRKPIESLAEWLHAPYRFTKGIPETNVYRFEPEGGYLGSLGSLPNLEKVEWSGAGELRVLCYLRAREDSMRLVEKLARPDREVLCAMPGADAGWVQEVARVGARVCRQGIDLPMAMEGASVFVSNGSAGMVCEAVMAGKPQLVVPIDWEKVLIGRRVQEEKLGVLLQGSPTRDALDKAIVEIGGQPIRRSSWSASDGTRSLTKLLERAVRSTTRVADAEDAIARPQE